MENLPKVLCAFNFTPSLIYANIKFLFDNDSAGGGKYWEIFGFNGEEVVIWPNDKVKEAVAASFLWIYIKEKLKSKEKELLINNKEKTVDYLSCLAKWHYLWAYGYIIKNLYEDKMTWIVNKINGGKLFSKENNIIDIWFQGISERILEQLDSEYFESRIVEGNDEIIPKGFNFKNWLRSDIAFKKLFLKFKRISTTSFPLE